MRVLERAILATEHRLVLLAPPSTAVPDHFDEVDFDLRRHQRLLRKLQQFRGTVYLRDGALRQHDVADDGAHETPEDEKAWHLLVLNGRDDIVASAWYLDHDNQVHFQRLCVRHSPLARQGGCRQALWDAVTADIDEARAHRLRYAEVGGWAVAGEHRHSCDGLVVALAAYALGRVCGDTIGITTATVKHGSSRILCRIGGRRLATSNAALPAYYDDRYRCTMEILRFDSRVPAPRFKPMVEMLHDTLASVSVVARPYWPNTHRSLRAVGPISFPRSMEPSRQPFELAYESVDASART